MSNLPKARKIELKWPGGHHNLKLEQNVSKTFIQGMLDATAMGAIKYNPVVIDFPRKMDAIACCRQRINEYRKTHNTEFLIDAANYLMYEFLSPKDPAAFYKPTDSDASPGRVKRFTGEIEKL